SSTPAPAASGRGTLAGDVAPHPELRAVLLGVGANTAHSAEARSARTRSRRSVGAGACSFCRALSDAPGVHGFPDGLCRRPRPCGGWVLAVGAHVLVVVPLEYGAQVDPMAGHWAFGAHGLHQRTQGIHLLAERRIVDRIGIERVDDVLDAVFGHAREQIATRFRRIDEKRALGGDGLARPQ